MTKKQKSIFAFDYMILLSVIFLLIAGVIAIYSCEYDPSENAPINNTYLKQIFFAGLGLVAVWVMVFINYTQLAEQRYILFAVSLALLIIVLIPIPHVTKRINGARSWLLFVQPSEFVKLSMIIVLAGFLDNVGEEIKSFKRFAQALLIAGAPMVLILLQPDFGTFLVYAAITLAMLFVAGARLRYLLGLITIGVIGLSIPMFIEFSKMNDTTESVFFLFFSNKFYILYVSWFFLFVAILLLVVNLYMKNRKIGLVAYIFFVLFLSTVTSLALDVGLKDYQKQRLLVFLNPELKSRSSGYTIIQTLIAIGSGGVTGTGFLKGSQTQLRFIPQQINDFIFSNIGEEWGFLGAVLVLGAYFLITFRGARIAYLAKDRLGSFVATGIVAMLLFHVLVNIGMAVGVMPITGIPLPFVSAGGSSLVTFCAAIGLLFNVEVRRFVHRDET